MSKRNRRPAGQSTPAEPAGLQEDGGEETLAIEAGDALPEASTELQEHPGTGAPPQMVGSAVVGPGETVTMTLIEPGEHGEVRFDDIAAEQAELAKLAVTFAPQGQAGAFEFREISKPNLQFTDEERSAAAKLYSALSKAMEEAMGYSPPADAFAELPEAAQKGFCLAVRYYTAEPITESPAGHVWCTSTETLAIRGAVNEQGRTVDRIRPGVRVLLPQDRFDANARYLKRV